MAVILKERGRGKFKPAPDYEVDEVKDLLNQKIEQERLAFADCCEEIEFDKISYDENKFNLLRLIKSLYIFYASFLDLWRNYNYNGRQWRRIA